MDSSPPSRSPGADMKEAVAEAVFGTFAVSVMLAILLGNALVILAVCLSQSLRQRRQNWLLVSLAGADVGVGVLVMPVSLLVELEGEWRLGGFLCEVWLALDVLFVTASILNLCIISLDRYLSLAQPLVHQERRSPRRMGLAIGFVWVLALLISSPPILGWRPHRPDGHCAPSDELGYVLFSSLGSFFVPLVVLGVVYVQIYRIIRRRSREQLKRSCNRRGTLKKCSEPSEVKEEPPLELESPKVRRLRERSFITLQRSLELTVLRNTMARAAAGAEGQQKHLLARERMIKTASCVQRRERRAVLSLGLILGAFAASWLPFFVLYATAPLGLFPSASDSLKTAAFWLGYCNSALNPVIYAVMNREYRVAFHDLLCCCRQ